MVPKSVLLSGAGDWLERMGRAFVPPKSAIRGVGEEESAPEMGISKVG